MKRLQAFKFELRANGGQQRQMRRFAGSCRFVYNKALAWQIAAYAKDRTVKFNYTKPANFLPTWKQEMPWLRQSASQPLQQALKNLQLAYQNFFEGRARFPRFKKRGVSDNFRYPQGVRLDQGTSRIFLPKIGWVRYRKSRQALGTIKNATVSLRDGKWFVSIHTEREVEPSVHPSTSVVGIDLGISRFATLSDGTFYAPLNGRRHRQRLRRYQRMMSRKVKFSKNWHKAKRRVQKLYNRISNCRRDYLHKATTTLSKNHARVCIEDLRVKSMSPSAAGSVEQPGKRVRAKAGLNRSILEQGWGEFRRQLDYKLNWRGGRLIVVPPHNTSRECPACGHVAAENRRTQDRFACINCAYEEHADVVGAINILARGHRVAACGEEGSGLGFKLKTKTSSAKQEPTEETARDAA
jgi:putative transposase